MHQPGLSADLDSFDLLDLVQVIQMARRDLALVVRAGSQSLGVLRFSQGELLWAEFGALRGEEAFIALAAQHSGSIEELSWDGREERNVHQPLARLVMQAVEYRDAHNNHQPQRAPEDESHNRPVQPANPAPSPVQAHERLNGSSSSPHLGSTPVTRVILPEDEPVPSWVREIYSASEAFSAQPTTAIPPVPPASSGAGPSSASSLSAAQTEPLTPPPPAAPEPSFSSLLQEEMAVQIPEPRVPLSIPNGKFTLPTLASGGWASPQPSGEQEDDSPTVPLPSMQSSLRDYASLREPSPQEAQRETVPALMPAQNSLPAQAITAQPAPEAAAPPPPSLSVSEAPPAPAVPAEPPAAPKMSSLSILEQLAYGGLASNSGAKAASSDASASAPFAGASVDSAAATLPTDQQQTQRPASRLLDGASAGQDHPLADAAESGSAVPASLGAANGLPAPAAALPNAEALKDVQRALETFAEQVGAACIATAVIRSDGTLVAEHKVRRGQDHDLGSPAYHMAQVLQSSLRTLLMGGWGDLEDTIITGSTHSVMLRRLGRAEKGLFHVAVLERSGNPGLCRVRMRSSEAALLQTL